MEQEKKYIIPNCSYFNLEATLDCGQAFRWRPQAGGYFGVVGERQVHIARVGEDIVLSGCDEREFEGFWRGYFDLDFDYEGLIQQHSHDRYIQLGAAYGGGQRLLRQPHFETLLSFIISANNNLRRIQGIVEGIAREHGRQLQPGVYAFPTPQELQEVSEADYAGLGAGYRAKYLTKTVAMIGDGFDLEQIEQMPYESAKARLMELPGVGGKVAECVLLYGYGFRRAFPFDVWTKRIVSGLYFGGQASEKQMHSLVHERFGEHAGVLQLFLFHYARHHKNDLDKGSLI